MSHDFKAGPLRLDVPVDREVLLQELDAAGYQDQAIRGFVSRFSRKAEFRLAEALAATNLPDPFCQLLRLWTLHAPVPRDQLALILPKSCHALIECGLLSEDGAEIRSRVVLSREHGLLSVRDFSGHLESNSTDQDFVACGNAAVTLAKLTPRKGGERMLDLGTGAGIHALLGATHARSIVATDINLRALNYAAFSAGLNGFEQVEFRAGSLFEPVAARRFDLVVSNPPFVISAGVEANFQHSGQAGDTLVESLVRDLPNYLTPRGFGVILLSWHHSSEQNWPDRPLAWLDGRVNTWLIRFRSYSAEDYAWAWARDRDPALIEQWQRQLRELGINRISYGILIVQDRQTLPAWVRVDELPEEVNEVGGQVGRIFRAEDLLSTNPSPAELLEQRLTLAPEAELQHTMRAQDGEWRVQSGRLRQTCGYEFAMEMDPVTCEILARCQGQLPLSEVLTSIAHRFQIDETQLQERFVEVLPRLLRQGLFGVK